MLGFAAALLISRSLFLIIISKDISSLLLEAFYLSFISVKLLAYVLLFPAGNASLFLFSMLFYVSSTKSCLLPTDVDDSISYLAFASFFILLSLGSLGFFTIIGTMAFYKGLYALPIGVRPANEGFPKRREEARST